LPIVLYYCLALFASVSSNAAFSDHLQCICLLSWAFGQYFSRHLPIIFWISFIITWGVSANLLEISWVYFFWLSFFVAYFWQICCIGAAALSAIYMGIWFAVMAYMFSGLQKANCPTSNSCINAKSIVLFWVPLFQIGSPVSMVKTRLYISSLFNKWVVCVLTVACGPFYTV